MRQRSSSRDLALRGARLGALVGLAFIGIGLIRGVALLLGGDRPSAPTLADLRMFGFYVGGFALAGGLLGAVRLPERGRTGILLGCMAGGVVVMLAIQAGSEGGLGGMHSADWIALPAIGALLGAAGAFGFLRR